MFCTCSLILLIWKTKISGQHIHMPWLKVLFSNMLYWDLSFPVHKNQATTANSRDTKKRVTRVTPSMLFFFQLCYFFGFAQNLRVFSQLFRVFAHFLQAFLVLIFQTQSGVSAFFIFFKLWQIAPPCDLPADKLYWKHCFLYISNQAVNLDLVDRSGPLTPWLTSQKASFVHDISGRAPGTKAD